MNPTVHKINITDKIGMFFDHVLFLPPPPPPSPSVWLNLVQRLCESFRSPNVIKRCRCVAGFSFFVNVANYYFASFLISFFLYIFLISYINNRFLLKCQLQHEVRFATKLLVYHEFRNLNTNKKRYHRLINISKATGNKHFYFGLRHYSN